MTLNEYVLSLKNKRIAVIGIGVSNTPLIRLLLSYGCDVTACDARTLDKMGEEAFELIRLGAKLRLGENYLEGLDHDVIFRTPGLMPFDEHLVRAAEQGSLITSEMEVFLSICPCKVFAITGSDGKTTTSSIVAELLKAAGYKVHLGGNIGHPLLCDSPQIKPEDMVVVELSSFQLHSMDCRADVALITNISPNHLDKHLDYQDYIDSKMSVFLGQNPDDRLVLNLNDGMSEYYKSKAKGNISWFSDSGAPSEGCLLENGSIYRIRNGGKTLIMAADEIKLPGHHNVLNYLAAFTAVDSYVSDRDCRRVAMDFAGVEHRLEQVRVLRGVTYINDSIGTSPTRTLAGLKSMKTKPVVIAGGYDKKISFDLLGEALCTYSKHVFLTGATALKIRDAIVNAPNYAQSGIGYDVIEDFDEAVLAAADFAKEGDLVLLSPACASFDKFKNFAERGKHFKKLIMELE